jgi:hypothetical protein
MEYMRVEKHGCAPAWSVPAHSAGHTRTLAYPSARRHIHRVELDAHVPACRSGGISALRMPQHTSDNAPYKYTVLLYVTAAVPSTFIGSLNRALLYIVLLVVSNTYTSSVSSALTCAQPGPMMQGPSMLAARTHLCTGAIGGDNAAENSHERAVGVQPYTCAPATLCHVHVVHGGLRCA